MRSALIMILAAASLQAQGLMEVEQMYLDFGMQAGEALYNIEIHNHIPGREPTLQRGVLALTISEVHDDGSGLLHYSYQSLSVDGEALDAPALKAMNEAMSQLEYRVSARWQLLEVQGTGGSDLAASREAYHEALDRLLAGEREALPQVVTRGLRLSAMLAAQRAIAGISAMPLAGSGLQQVFDALLADPHAELDEHNSQTLGPFTVESEVALTGRYLLGMRRLFGYQGKFSAGMEQGGFEAFNSGMYTHWGLAHEVESGLEYYLGPFGGSVRTRLELIGFSQAAAARASDHCSSCEQAVGDGARQLHGADGQTHRFCCEQCEMDFLRLGMNKALSTCAHCAATGSGFRVLSDAQGAKHAFCCSNCQQAYLFGSD